MKVLFLDNLIWQLSLSACEKNLVMPGQFGICHHFCHGLWKLWQMRTYNHCIPHQPGLPDFLTCVEKHGKAWVRGYLFVCQFSKFLQQCSKIGCEALANQLLDLQLVVWLNASRVKNLIRLSKTVARTWKMVVQCVKVISRKCFLASHNCNSISFVPVGVLSMYQWKLPCIALFRAVERQLVDFVHPILH